MRRGSTFAVALGLSTLLVAACDRTPEVDDRMEEAGRDAGAAADRAGNGAADAVDGVAAETDAAQQTMQIKTALMADDLVDASDINVDTSAETKTVTLKGRVATKEQKDAAERIAREKAPDYTIDNQLRVGRE